MSRKGREKAVDKLRQWITREIAEWMHPSYVPIVETPGGKLVASIIHAWHPARSQKVWRGPDTFASPTDGPDSAAYN